MNRGRRRAGLVALVALALALGRPRRVVVEGPSMEPTLRGGDRLWVLPWLGPRPGDVVALRRPGGGGGLLVKRVAARRGAQVVVAGDNPGQSTDSRTFGPVDRGTVVGRVVYRYAPASRAGPVPNAGAGGERGTIAW